MRDRILFPSLRIGQPYFAGILACNLELGRCCVHFQQQLVVLDHDIVSVSFIENQMRLPSGRSLSFGVDRNKDESNQARQRNQRDQPDDQAADDLFLSLIHHRHPP